MLNVVIFNVMAFLTVAHNSLHVHTEQRLQRYQTRCTRRFTPGACIGHVAAVWTYEFHIQNCTERLGCPDALRTNRFKSYRHCINRCRSLIDMYSHILAMDTERNYSDQSFLRTPVGRREGTELREIFKGEPYNEDNEDPDDNDSGDEPIYNPTVMSEDEDTIARRELIPPDIDNIDDTYLSV
ncbi:uncharacterized protein LOC128200715 [Galleria mellonella]|uniref:Uncharacterized protein LOC128200715 n=1 Tax=Galleria mellonella TaxID=7137 RepID=A0ABM3MHS3_GALME|nr:uncharacterized protein LOC128200715 [Galleria mellonella]